MIFKVIWEFRDVGDELLDKGFGLKKRICKWSLLLWIEFLDCGGKT